jgi:wyosine [tRNA(Phe)-imidazoG37] synthetase (radical SAM superfamily)
LKKSHGKELTRGKNESLFKMAGMSIIYGPVPSWRLGRSLGIDLLNTQRKVCSFNCVYCQLGNTGRFAVEPAEFVSLEQFASEVRSVRQIEADYATFSGMGEPTLAGNLGEAIQLARSILDLPVAVLTNSSLMFRDDVKHQLAHADTVVAKLDVPSQQLLALVNRPFPELRFAGIVEGIRRFRDEYRGRLALQIMFIEANRNYASEIAALARQFAPDEVQINTPLRPSRVKPLAPKSVAEAKREFTGFKDVVTVYEAPKPETVPVDLAETLRRRPKL